VPKHRLLVIEAAQAIIDALSGRFGCGGHWTPCGGCLRNRLLPWRFGSGWVAEIAGHYQQALEGDAVFKLVFA
jgi:hypothetical protein